MNSPLVSICIPAWKTDFLEQAIQSAISQTYDFIEVIIIDDCSPNDVRSIVSHFDSPRIKYYSVNKNIGNNDPSLTWEYAVSLSNGDYFSILCDDDFYDVEYVEKLIELTNKYPKASVLRSGVKVINRKGEVVDYFGASPEYQTFEWFLFERLRGRQQGTISEFFFKRKTFEETGGFVHMPKAWGSDNLTVLKISLTGG